MNIGLTHNYQNIVEFRMLNMANFISGPMRGAGVKTAVAVSGAAGDQNIRALISLP
jgi:hypothetical protein